MQCRHKINLSTTNPDCDFIFYQTADLSQMVLSAIFVFASINFVMNRTSPCSKWRTASCLRSFVAQRTIGTTHLNSSRFSAMFAVICFFLSQSHHMTPNSRRINLFVLITKFIFASRINLRNQSGNKLPKKTLFISLVLPPWHNIFACKKSINQSKSKNFKLNACLPTSRSPNVRQM